MKTISSKKIIWKSGTAMRLLTFFFENPSNEFYAKKITDLTELSLGAVHNHLKTLESQGFILARREGRMTFFRLNRESEIVKILKVAYSLSHVVVDAIKKAGSAVEGVEIYLYGSVARGEDLEDSDWDILVLGKSKLSIVMNALRQAIVAAKPRDVRVSLHTKLEWSRTAKEDPSFYERVEKDKIRLV